MTVNEAVTQILKDYMPRVQVRRGNGLSRNMNQTLRSYEQIPLIIVRTVEMLADTEALFGFTGAVRIHTMDLYRNLLDAHDDWVREIPRVRNDAFTVVRYPSRSSVQANENEGHPTHDRLVGSLAFERKPLLPFHQFTAAWTIGRRIGLIEGRGEIGLHRSVLAKLRGSVTF